MERRSIAKLVSQVGGSKLPPHVSIKDNVFSLVDDAGNRVHVGPTLNCVVLDMNEKRSRLFWGQDAVYDEDNQSPPLCFSDNGIAPSTRSLEPQAKSCRPDREGIIGCRWSVWGSARSKKTGEGIPACSEGVKLALMIVKLKDADKRPGSKEWIPAIEKAPGTVFFFRVPPASLGAVSSYGKTVQSMGKIPEIAWTGEIDVQTEPYHLVTRITFRGTGTVQFQAVGYISEQIDRTITEVDQYKINVAIGRDDEPITALPAPTGVPISPGELEEARQADAAMARATLPQPRPPVAPAPPRRGRPRKDNDAPAAPKPGPGMVAGFVDIRSDEERQRFEPKPNSRIVTTEEIRDEARARQEQESKEAAEQFGITDQAPEPPEDVLDQFMKLDLK